jgi:hypothetical protein
VAGSVFGDSGFGFVGIVSSPFKIPLVFVGKRVHNVYYLHYVDSKVKGDYADSIEALYWRGEAEAQRPAEYQARQTDMGQDRAVPISPHVPDPDANY